LGCFTISHSCTMLGGGRLVHKHLKESKDNSAIVKAFVENSTTLKKFLTRYFSVQQDIEDVVQEAFLRAYQAEEKKIIEHPKAFLFRIVKNLALTELTKKSRQITTYIEDSDPSVVIDNEFSPEGEFESLQSLGIYCEAVANLPIKCRHVYLMRKVHGLSHKEIAHRMELSVSSIEKHLSTGVLQCRAYVRKRKDGKSVDPTQSTHSSLDILGEQIL